VPVDADAGLSLGSDAAISHLGSLLLIYLCFLAKPLIIIKLGLSKFLIFFSASLLGFSSHDSNPES
jgi:hypothetical protein